MEMYEKINSLKQCLQQNETEQGFQTERSDVLFFPILKKTEAGSHLVVPGIPSP